MKASNFLKVNYPGVILVVLLGIAAIALSQKYAGPVMLFAILIGLALHPAYESDNLKAVAFLRPSRLALCLQE